MENFAELAMIELRSENQVPMALTQETNQEFSHV